MKRILSVFLALSMLLGLTCAMAMTAAAADVPGDWTTYIAASEYPAEGEDTTGRVFKPEAGYKYTDEGFTIVPADYTDSTPFMTVQSKELMPVKEGVYMEFRVDDFAYGGPEGNIDNWICLSITNKPKVTPGLTTFGGGWMGLIRSDGVKEDAKVESCNTKEAVGDYGGEFRVIGSSNIKTKKDDQGHEIYTLEVTCSGSQYTIKVNGVVVAGLGDISANLNGMNQSGEFYVGVTLYSSVKDGKAAMTLLKYGTDKNHAYVPTGTDSKEPQPNLFKVAEIADPSTVPQNQPALYWDASVAAPPNGTNVTLTALGDNAFRVNMSAELGYFSWNMSRSTSYSGTDFPIFTVLLRNFYGEAGTLWYYGGNILGAADTNKEAWNINDGYYYNGGDDEYVLVTVDLSELWEGRINGLRFDFATSENGREFDICYMGFFRSEEEGVSFCEARLTEMGIVVGEQETENQTVEDTDTDEVTEETAEETAEETTEAETQPSETSDPAVTDAPETEQGCASVMGMSAACLLLFAVAAGAVVRKREA